MRHATEEEILDLAENAGGAEDRAHLVRCAACATRVEETQLALAAARRTEVPEPSPLYWEALRQSVSRRISEEKHAPSRFWLLLPAAVAAALVAVVLMRPAPSPRSEPPLAAWSALPPAEDDAGLAVLEGLAVAGGALPAWDEERGLGAFLAGLTDEDSRALADSLRRAGQGGES